jgi:hypothetical protein
MLSEINPTAPFSDNFRIKDADDDDDDQPPTSNICFIAGTKVLTDQGTNVMSNLMASLYKQCGVTGIRMLAYLDRAHICSVKIVNTRKT